MIILLEFRNFRNFNVIFGVKLASHMHYQVTTVVACDSVSFGFKPQVT